MLCFLGSVGEVHKVIQHELWCLANIQVHRGKTKVWNRARVKPARYDEVIAAARSMKEEARVWTRDQGARPAPTDLGPLLFPSWALPS